MFQPVIYQLDRVPCSGDPCCEKDWVQTEETGAIGAYGYNATEPRTFLLHLLWSPNKPGTSVRFEWSVWKREFFHPSSGPDTSTLTLVGEYSEEVPLSSGSDYFGQWRVTSSEQTIPNDTSVSGTGGAYTNTQYIRAGPRGCPFLLDVGTGVATKSQSKFGYPAWIIVDGEPVRIYKQQNAGGSPQYSGQIRAFAPSAGGSMSAAVYVRAAGWTIPFPWQALVPGVKAPTSFTPTVATWKRSESDILTIALSDEFTTSEMVGICSDYVATHEPLLEGVIEPVGIPRKVVCERWISKAETDCRLTKGTLGFLAQLQFFDEANPPTFEWTVKEYHLNLDTGEKSETEFSRSYTPIRDESGLFPSIEGKEYPVPSAGNNERISVDLGDPPDVSGHFYTEPTGLLIAT